MAEETKKVSEKVEKMVEEVSKLSVLELSELVTALQEKLGVSAAMPVAAAAPAAGGAEAGAAAADEGGNKTVVMVDAGGNKIGVIKLVREYTGLGLGEAKTLSESGGNIKENIEKKEADEIVAKFKEAGATCEIA